MKRANFGSLLFVGGTLLFLIAPSSESSAQGGESGNADGATKVAAIAAAAGVVTPTVMPASAKSVVAANAGLKGVTAPDLGTSANCGENQVEVDGDYCPALEQKCIR